MTLTQKLTFAKQGITDVSKLDELIEEAVLDHETRVADLESVTASPGAGVAAVLAAGLGESAVYDHADDVGTDPLLAAAAGARALIIMAVVTEATAGTTTEPLFSIGEEDGAADKFGAIGEGELAGTLNAVYFFAGTLTADKALEITVADGTGGTEAGKVAITVLAFPSVS